MRGDPAFFGEQSKFILQDEVYEVADGAAMISVEDYERRLMDLPPGLLSQKPQTQSYEHGLKTEM